MTDPEAVWFRRPSEDHPGTLNATYQLLDQRVVQGRADEEALGGQTFARVLTDVAAFAGALRGFAVVPGDRVLLHLSDGSDLVVALLAGARLGAVVVLVDPETSPSEVARALDATEPRVVVTGDQPVLGLALADADHLPGAVIGAGISSDLVTGIDAQVLPWAMAVQAGQTDPAGAADVSPTTPALVLWPAWSAPDAAEVGVRLRTTLDVAVTLAGLALPLEPGALLAALRG